MIRNDVVNECSSWILYSDRVIFFHDIEAVLCQNGFQTFSFSFVEVIYIIVAHEHQWFFLSNGIIDAG